MTVLPLDHLSGRFDRAPELLSAAVAASAETADIICCTEVSGRARGAALARPGWTVSRGPDGDLGEIALLSRDAAWREVTGATVVLGPDLGPGGQVVARIALYSHATADETALVSAAHLPASVEGGWAARSSRAVAHQAAVQAWRRELRRWRLAHRPSAEVVTADWNLNLQRRFVRGWIRAAWPGLRLPAPVPRGGTHRGGRLIDWPLTRGVDGASFEILPESAASDHRGIRVTGTIRPAAGAIPPH